MPHSRLTIVIALLFLLGLADSAAFKMYMFELATTGSISFSDFLVTTELVSQVSEATQLRARLRGVLKQNRAGQSGSVGKHVGSYNEQRGTSSGSQAAGDDDCRASATSVNAADWLTIVKTIEEYLPHLLGVFNCVQTDDLIVRYEPVFSWRTSISGTRFRGAQRIALGGLHYELASTLLTYALALSNLSAATVASLGWYERDRSLSLDQRKRNDERLKWAADTLCRAAGILLYLSTQLIPKWSDHVGSLDGLPPDLTTEATLALSNVCMAQAQALAIRKLVSPSIAKAVDTLTPGPPLDKNHPSASLLAKLHLNVVEQMESAVALLKTIADKRRRKSANHAGTQIGLSANHEHELASRLSASRDRADHEHDDDMVETNRGAGAQATSKRNKLLGRFKLGSSKSSPPRSASVHSGPHDVARSSGHLSASTAGAPVDCDVEISSSLLKYLGFGAAFHRSMAYKWLAIDHGESSSRIGTAIAYLSLSSALLSSSTMRDGAPSHALIPSSLLLNKSTKSGSAGGVVEQELATVTHWLVSYRKLNDTVAFQRVPASDEVTSNVPAGRPALGAKPYTLPSPAWGPASAGYKGRGHALHLASETLHLLDEHHPARRELVGIHATAAETHATAHTHYAGHGAYY